ncbi:MAG: hypothetical protein AB7P02_06635 [Alphaproteobacteria bacterium]
MSDSTPRLTTEEFRARIAAAGFPVPEERLAALLAAHGDLQTMVGRLRRASYGYGDEPAHVFEPGTSP